MAFYDYYDFRPYVSVGARRAQAVREAAKLLKQGRKLSPVVVDGRKIAGTFWGKSWCDNLERYSDFANRLPRGRTYVRNGSVIDLQVGPGRVTALVSGSEMYDVQVTVGPVPGSRWRTICRDCSGAIDSIVELLQGRFSKGVMSRLCEEKAGLFPSPKEIHFTCSCPDWASMCKHVAAVLYGIGARLDQQPELLFTLRNVESRELIARAGSDLSKSRKGAAGVKVLANDDLSEMFGIEMAPAAPKKRRAGRVVARVAGAAGTSPVTAAGAAAKAALAKPRTTKAADATTKAGAKTGVKAGGKVRAKAKSPVKSASTRRQPKPRRTAASRRAVSESMRNYWAARRAAIKKPKT